MSARRFALLAALAFAVIFVAGNLISGSWLRSWRLDLTQNQLYSLSPGTQSTLDKLSEPVQLTFYYSRDAAANIPQIHEYAARIREMLRTFAARSHGRVRFVEVNVKPYTEEEDQAGEAGVEGLRPYQGADPIYFGLSGSNAVDDHRTIPSFDPQREPFLEYEITRIIYELERTERTRVALITALPMDPAVAADPSFPSGQSLFSSEMGRMMDVVKLPPNFVDIPDVDVLAIIHPWPLTPAQSYAVDQFVMRTGRVFVAVDPASLAAQQAGGEYGGPSLIPPSSTLEPLMSRWGVGMAPTVVLDGENALPVQTQGPDGQTGEAPQPLFFRVPPENLDREDLMTAWLQRGIYFGLAGGLTWSDRDGVTVAPLARTSGQTMRLPAQSALARPSPTEIMSMWQSTGGRRETVALRLSGNLVTAFPDGAPPPDAPMEGAPPPPPATHTGPQLTQSQTPAQIVIVSDVDFLSDDFYVDRSGAPAADNSAFALNAIDVLGGSADLVSLRSRAPAMRPMKRLEDMERDAQQRIESEQRRLQADMQEAQNRIAQLQARGRGSGYFTGNLGAELTTEENAELERFRRRLLEARTSLRNVERNLRSDIDRLKAVLVFINVWLAPLLVAGVGLFFFWRRQRRGGARG